MRRFISWFFFLVGMTVLGGCAGTTPAVRSDTGWVITPTPSHEPYANAPDYVYAFPEGGCWAEGLWHDPCPWVTGPDFGFYVNYGGIYYKQPGFDWSRRHGFAPPGQPNYRSEDDGLNTSHHGLPVRRN